MKKRVVLAVLPVFAIIFEILPYGAVLIFANPDKTITQYYSYFDLTTFGYANFGPFLTAILTVLLFILALINLIIAKKGLLTAIKTVSCMSVFTSIMPLMFGLRFFTAIALIITLILISEAAVSIFYKK